MNSTYLRSNSLRQNKMAVARAGVECRMGDAGNS